MNKPPFKKFPKLSSEKIILREIIDADIPDIIELSFYDGKPAENAAQAFKMQERINKDYQKGDSIHWGIANIKSNKIIGTCGYYRGFEAGSGELGCVLLREFRGLGIMTSALKLAIDFGLKNMELKRINAITTKQNYRAIKLLNRLGFGKLDSLAEDEIEFEIIGERAQNLRNNKK